MFFWIAMQSKHPGLKQEFCLLKKGIRIRIGPWIEHLSSSRSCYPHNKLGHLGVRSLHTNDLLSFSFSLFAPKPKLYSITQGPPHSILRAEERKGKRNKSWLVPLQSRPNVVHFSASYLYDRAFSLPLFPESPFLSLF